MDTEDDKGRTALSHAARYGSLDSIAVLAQHQANMFHADTDGRTPLDIAEECGRLEAAMQLRRCVARLCTQSTGWQSCTGKPIICSRGHAVSLCRLIRAAFTLMDTWGQPCCQYCYGPEDVPAWTCLALRNKHALVRV